MRRLSSVFAPAAAAAVPFAAFAAFDVADASANSVAFSHADNREWAV